MIARYSNRLSFDPPATGTTDARRLKITHPSFAAVGKLDPLSARLALLLRAHPALAADLSIRGPDVEGAVAALDTATKKAHVSWITSRLKLGTTTPTIL